jgi:hypothetical protein
MDWLGIVVAGLVATAALSMLMYGGPMMGMPRMNIAQTIGSMALPLGGAASTFGMMMHLMMGIAFTIAYAGVWSGLDINVTWWSGLLFGLVHAAVAVMGMGMMMKMHKEVKAGRLASPLAGGAKSVMGMVMGHMVFGLVAALVYGAYV